MSINYEAFFDNRLVNTQKKDIWGLQLLKAWTWIESEMHLMHIFTHLQGILLIRDMVVKRWTRQFGCETIHPTQKFTSMNLLQMPCVITWA